VGNSNPLESLGVFLMMAPLANIAKVSTGCFAGRLATQSGYREALMASGADSPCQPNLQFQSAIGWSVRWEFRPHPK